MNRYSYIRSIDACLWTKFSSPYSNIKNMHVCVCVCVSYLVEQWTVCDGNTQRSEASAQHHVIRSIITVAATPTGNKPGHSHSTEDHPTQRQKKGSG